MKIRAIVFLMLVTLVAGSIAACAAGGSAPTPLPIRPTRTSYPTFTPTVRAAAPTAIPPSQTTASQPTAPPPADTPIPSPTSAPAPTKPKPTATPRPPTPTPAPAFDYVIIEQRVKSRTEEPNLMAVNIELHAVDKAGNLLGGVVFRDLELGGEVVSGEKGPGQAAFTFTSAQTYRIIVKADGSGRAVTSQQTLPFTLNFSRSDEVNQLLMAAGLCGPLEDCRRIIHFTAVIKFQRQW